VIAKLLIIFLSNMKSETNAQLKRQQLTGHGVGKRKTAEETRLAAVLATTPSQVPKKSKKKQSALQPVVPTDLKVAALLEWRPPINGTHYDLHELVTWQHKACGYVVLKRKGVSLEKFHPSYQGEQNAGSLAPEPG
jgi:arginine/lysine/ornithine decarboxylase